MTKDFLVVFEAGPTSFGAFAPDIDGCFVVGETFEVARQRFLDASKAHLEWLALDHEPIPEPATTTFDFRREEDDEIGHYVVEWLPIPVPQTDSRALTAA